MFYWVNCQASFFWTVPKKVLFVLVISIFNAELGHIYFNYQGWLRPAPAICRITTHKGNGNHKLAWDEKQFVAEQIEELLFLGCIRKVRGC